MSVPSDGSMKSSRVQVWPGSGSGRSYGRPFIVSFSQFSPSSTQASSTCPTDNRNRAHAYGETR